jgi:hypothetical protein
VLGAVCRGKKKQLSFFYPTRGTRHPSPASALGLFTFDLKMETRPDGLSVAGALSVPDGIAECGTTTPKGRDREGS